MGKTAFNGPVYGAKSLLWSVQADNLPISTAAQTVASITVPPGEDWVITDFAVFRGSSGSTDFTARLVDDSTAIASVAITSSAASGSGSTRLAKTDGEYTGTLVAEGSVLSFTVQNGNSSAVGSSAVYGWAYGFPRWLQASTLGF